VYKSSTTHVSVTFASITNAARHAQRSVHVFSVRLFFSSL